MPHMFHNGVKVSATFAASLVVSPALGTWIIQFFDGGETQVVLLATIITAVNLLFIVLVVPESLPEELRKTTWGSAISWKQVDPFGVSWHLNSPPFPTHSSPLALPLCLHPTLATSLCCGFILLDRLLSLLIVVRSYLSGIHVVCLSDEGPVPTSLLSFPPLVFNI